MRISDWSSDVCSSDLNDPSQWVIVQSHDAIVPDELVQRARSLMKDAAPTATGSPLSTHFFTGFAKCGLCGGAMVVETAKGRSQRYSYYNCSTWRKTAQCRSEEHTSELQSLMRNSSAVFCLNKKTHHNITI